MRRSLCASLLDLGVVPSGSSPARAIASTVRLAQRADSLGLARFWLAEHHGVKGLVSSAPAVLVGHIASQTNFIRVGSGGVLLSHHSPLVVAEQFGTLATIYPNRIDLGVTRSLGSDNAITSAIRIDAHDRRVVFPDLVKELSLYFEDKSADQIQAIPGAGLHVPLFVLGASEQSAVLAGELSLPFVFAAHLHPESQPAALSAYRRHFQPSTDRDRPYVIICSPLILSDSQDHAEMLFTTTQRCYLSMIRDEDTFLQAPARLDLICTARERQLISNQLKNAIVGDLKSAIRHLRSLVDDSHCDEIMALSLLHDEEDRIRCCDLFVQAAAEVQ